MKNNYWILALILIAFLCGCIHNRQFSPDKTIVENFPMTFESNQNELEKENVRLNFQLRATKPGDTLAFIARVNNDSNDSLFLNPSELQIETSQHLRSDVIWYDSKKLTIPPQSADTILFKYTPINNLNLFNSANYRGDVDSVYFLEPNFIYKRNNEKILLGEKVRFQLNDSVYQNYKSRFSKNNRITLFQFGDKEFFRKNLTEHLSKLKIVDDPINVQVFGNDVIVQGLILKFNFYTLDANLYLKAKIVNHGLHQIIIDPKKFRITTGDKTLNPQIIDIKNSVPMKMKNCYPVIKSGRFEMELKYENFNSNEFTMDFNGILLNDMKSTLFSTYLLFENN